MWRTCITLPVLRNSVMVGRTTISRNGHRRQTKNNSWQIFAQYQAATWISPLAQCGELP
jgi:hypothetical protein